MGRKTRKQVKRIQKEIERLKEEVRKVELRPCHGDADLKKKEEELASLKREMYELEKEANQYVMYISGLGRGGK